MDKNKIIEAAAKLVAKGAYDKAIKEYRRVLDADPKDVRVLQKMGELYQKKNDNAAAASYFTKVAESYSSDGFFLKAVALYKQVLKLDPTLVEVNLRLAELHHQLQLLSEASSYYQLVASHYEKAGNARASLDTLKKIVELDPENVSSRIKLAEMYARENMKADATQEFQRAAEYLKRNSRLDDYYRVLERLSALDPDNLQLGRELAESYLVRGDQKRALAKLQICFKADPQDVQTLSLLANAFQGLGQISKTVSVYKELAKIFAAQDRSEEAQQIWSKIAELEPNDPDLAGSRGGQIPSFAPARMAPPPPLPPRGASPAPTRPAEKAVKPTREQLAKLLTETDVYVKYGLHDKALEHLGKIFAVDPESLDAHEKAYHVYVAAANNAQAAEQLLNVLRLCTRLNAADRAQPYLKTILWQNPKHPEVATFVSVLGNGEAPESEPEFETVPDDAILIDSTHEEIAVPDAPAFPEPASFEDLALESASAMLTEDAVDEDAVISLEGQDAVALEAPEGGEVVDQSGPTLPVDYDLQEDTAEWEEGGQQPAQPADFAEEPAAFELELEDQTPVDEPAAHAPEGDSAPQFVEGDSASEECEEARFFIDQGLLEEAREILETVAIAYPGHATAKALLLDVEQLEASRGPSSTGEAEPDPSAGEATDAFDLAAELAQELGEAGSEETAEGGDDFQYSVDEVFAEFKKGLEKVVKPEDVDTHYDLGIAYKEMGLIDDAIAEFGIAREGCIGKKKEIDCLTMIALLQKSKGDPGAAVESYKRALMSEHAVGELEKALEFELGSAWESVGKPGKALFHYSKVAKLDPNYREVSNLVSTLARTTKPEADPLPPKRQGTGMNGLNGVHGKASASEPAEKAGANKTSDSPGPAGKRKAGYL